MHQCVLCELLVKLPRNNNSREGNDVDFQKHDKHLKLVWHEILQRDEADKFGDTNCVFVASTRFVATKHSGTRHVQGPMQSFCRRAK